MIKSIYRLPDVMKVTGLSPSSIYLAVSIDKFPKPMKIGRRAIGWSESSIEDWIQKLQEKNNENT